MLPAPGAPMCFFSEGSAFPGPEYSAATPLDAELVEEFCRAYLGLMSLGTPNDTSDLPAPPPPSEVTLPSTTPSADADARLAALPTVRPRPRPADSLTSPCSSAVAAAAESRGGRLPSPLPRDPASPLAAVPVVEAVEARKICKSFRLYGTCRFGARCLFHHVAEPSIPMASAPASLTVSDTTTSEAGISSAARSSTRTTTVSLSPTMPHAAEERSDVECEGLSLDGSRTPSEEFRWDALRDRALDKHHIPSLIRASPSADAPSSQSRSSSGSKGSGRPPCAPRHSEPAQEPAEEHADVPVLPRDDSTVVDELQDAVADCGVGDADPTTEVTTSTVAVSTVTRRRRRKNRKSREKLRGMSADAPAFVPAWATQGMPTLGPEHMALMSAAQGGMLSLPSSLSLGSAPMWCSVLIQPLPSLHLPSSSSSVPQPYAAMMMLPAGQQWLPPTPYCE